MTNIDNTAAALTMCASFGADPDEVPASLARKRPNATRVRLLTTAMNIADTFELRGTRDDMRREARYALRGWGRGAHDVAEAIVKRAVLKHERAAAERGEEARTHYIPSLVSRNACGMGSAFNVTNVPDLVRCAACRDAASLAGEGMTTAEYMAAHADARVGEPTATTPVLHDQCTTGDPCGDCSEAMFDAGLAAGSTRLQCP